MSYRATAALLAVLLILGGVVYFTSQSPAPSAAGAADKPVPILALTPTSVTKIVIVGTDKTTEVSKKGDAWEIVQPTAGPADSARIGGWVDQLATLSAQRTIDDAGDLSTYGLATPRIKLEVGLSDGKSVNLQFGDKTPDGGAFYVRLPDDAAKAKAVYLIGSSLGDDLTSALAKPPVAIPTPTPLPTLVPATITPPGAAGTPTATPTPGG